MKKKIANLTLIAVSSILAIILIPMYVNFYKEAPPEFQNLYYAVGASVVGITLHFLKKYQKIQKRYVLTAESLELLMLAASPTFVSFVIIGNASSNSLYIRLLISLFVIGSWYGFTLYNLTRPSNVVEGKNAFSSTISLFFGILSIIVLGFIVIILAQ